MSFLDKLKNRHSGPPTPPRRTDDNADFEWPVEEFDDEEGDVYEAPPCERPPVRVPQRQVEEDVYLDKTSNPAVPQRQAAPPQKPSKPPKTQQCDNSSSKKPPEIDRNNKPGKKKMAPPPLAARPPVPGFFEEDVYLDPNEDQDDNDDLYLEPTEACSPVQRAPIKVPQSPKKPMAPAAKPMIKPPVPRAKSSSILPLLNDLKPDRRATFPSIPPPVTSKPPLSANLKPKPSPPNHPMVDTKPMGSCAGMRITKQSGVENKEWFAGDSSRRTADDCLRKINKDGAFLIRHSSTQGAQQPYTLAVLYQQKVFNIPIRYLEEMQGYALGKDGKKNEEIFSSLDEMVSHHKNNQLLLIDSKSQTKHTTYLSYAVRP
ncbi:uncharacterized protein KZ484_003930 isoform 2-T2 [Pholidichthys leucotaenia]